MGSRKWWTMLEVICARQDVNTKSDEALSYHCHWSCLDVHSHARLGISQSYYPIEASQQPKEGDIMIPNLS